MERDNYMTSVYRQDACDHKQTGKKHRPVLCLRMNLAPKLMESLTVFCEHCENKYKDYVKIAVIHSLIY